MSQARLDEILGTIVPAGTRKTPGRAPLTNHAEHAAAIWPSIEITYQNETLGLNCHELVGRPIDYYARLYQGRDFHLDAQLIGVHGESRDDVEAKLLQTLEKVASLAPSDRPAEIEKHQA